MDDLNRLIAKKEREKPGFTPAVEKRKGELLIAVRLREAREKLKLTQLKSPRNGLSASKVFLRLKMQKIIIFRFIL
ncbi:MAG: hypothetical protein ISS67_03230 [Desulfobacterales bacterium]|uniref:Uncharacterized protein n=1 Tax=Candidatus Desulfaltia bathyphila TaxID=2841697 RepID=A0A8J6N3V8_9BACT|nr:hypothetical protein [Candidatus Desulfaltia bathyphila]MBL7195607.1 hypothetical protein [Desulfobacterales bacterium]MBL7207522.1 hypothetical protein [Desulfobacterales bacterium]